MSTIAELREGIAVNLRTISGLAATALAAADPHAPYAYVLPSPTFIDFDSAFMRGADEYHFTVRVIAALAADQQGAQVLLDGYLNPSGATSVKAAIEADSTLGGKAFDLRVQSASNYGTFIVNDVAFLGAEFSVQVFA